MVPVSLERIVFVAWCLSTSPWCNDCNTSCCESDTVLLDDDEDDEQDSYASLTNLDVDTWRSAADANFCWPSIAAAVEEEAILTGFGRVVVVCWSSGDRLDTSTGGDSGNVTRGSAPSTGATWPELWYEVTSGSTGSTLSPQPVNRWWSCCCCCKFCSSDDDMVVTSDTWRWTRCDVDDVDDSCVVREHDDNDEDDDCKEDNDDDVFCKDDDACFEQQY